MVFNMVIYVACLLLGAGEHALAVLREQAGDAKGSVEVVGKLLALNKAYRAGLRRVVGVRVLGRKLDLAARGDGAGHRARERV